MKRFLKILICAVLAAALCAGAFAAVVAARRASADRYVRALAPVRTEERQYVTFGKYPQSAVEDEALLARLNALDLKWVSYGYYNGAGTLGSAVQSDFMQYADVAFEGETYRAIKLTEYRSYCCHQVPMANWQASVFKHQFELNTVYWYRFDPIRWIVLSAEENLLLAEFVLDSQPINSVIYSKTPKADFNSREFYKDAAFTTYAADYYESDIRAWLNTTFLNTAFSAEEAQWIVCSDLDNSSWTPGKSKFDAQDSTDRVFLLSYDETTNPAYGFSPRSEKADKNRIAYPTPYTLIQGHWIHPTGVSYWWLRTMKGDTALKGAALNLAVNYTGAITLIYLTPYSPDCVDTGIRPAIRLGELPNG